MKSKENRALTKYKEASIAVKTQDGRGKWYSK